MSVRSKSIDKSKRYAGVKANDFVNKARANESSRATARTQGWANLGKVAGRRIPPPANLPSLKSETGTIISAFDPTIPTGTSHGWKASGNQIPTNVAVNQTRPLTPSKQPTQQQLDSLPAHVSTPPPPSSSSAMLTSDIDKSRGSATWSTITAGSTTGNSNDQPPNLLALNDFPRLATQDNKNTKSQSDSLVTSMSTTSQGPSLRPANLASWKEGGGRAQPMPNDITKDSNDNTTNLSTLSIQSPMLPTNPSPGLLQPQMQNSNNQSYMRMYQQQQQQQQPQMWSYNLGNSYGSYGTNQPSASMSMHQLHHPQRISPYGNNAQSQQRLNTSTDYKTPTILRNKDIDDLSKLTDNVTWASASQEVNYEEKIRFSDDEDNDITDNNNNKSRRYNNSQQQSKQTYPQVLQNNNNRSLHTNYSQQQNTRSRLLQDDEHVKQMQDDKNSELINTLTVAKQRRDEQERNLRDSSQRTPTSTNVQKPYDDQKQIPGYQTRPLITSTGQDNSSSSQVESTSLWGQSTNAATSRTRHDTTDSQTFAMKSWSEQMDSFNYASLHEKSGGQVDNDDHHDDNTPAAIASTSSVPRKYSRSPSESSSQSQADNRTATDRSKHYLISTRNETKSTVIPLKTSSTNILRVKNKTTDVIDYFDNNEQCGDWEDNSFNTNTRTTHSYSNDRRTTNAHQQNFSEDFSQKSNRNNEQTNDFNRTKHSSKARQNVTNRSSDISSKPESKAANNKNQAWRPLSPPRPIDTNDPTPQEAISLKSQTKTNDVHDRRQSAPVERKQRYTTTTINGASIPPLMSVRSDVPPTSVQTSTTLKNFKTSNQSQRQDYNSSSHYSQRNDFFNETNDAAWGNDDEYYDDETGYYDSNIQTHQRQYHSNSHHRGYIALGSYGRYRRGGALRHQQQYNTYNVNPTSSSLSTSQLNTSTGSKTKKLGSNRTTIVTKKSTEPSEQPKPAVEPTKVTIDETTKTSSSSELENKPSTSDDVSKAKPTETPSVPVETEESKEHVIKTIENDSKIMLQNETESTATNKKQTTITSQKKVNKDQQNYHYQHHRNNYGRTAQEYEITKMTSHSYYGTTTRRTMRGGRNACMHDLSGGYYYEHPQQRYNNRYGYSSEHYSQQHQTHSGTKTTERTGSSSATQDRQQTKQSISKGNNTNTNFRLQSASDNEQKEGEEWETASESSANMRSGHADTNSQQISKSTINEPKLAIRDRTPPKKSFTSQRPLNSRYNETGIHRRSHNLHDRGGKATRTTVHRTSRSATNHKTNILTQKSDTDNSSTTTKQVTAIKKDQHRHSLEGYDLNNVAGVVKIETLPASALEEENEAFDDGGEEFCVVMSKRGRKEQKAAQLSKQNAIESTPAAVNDQPIKSIPTTNDEQQITEKTSNDVNQTTSTRARSGKSVPPRFNSKSSSSTTRQQHNTKTDHQHSQMYYYDPNYYYYDQNQYYDHDGSYYNYGNYNQSHRQSSTSTRRKQRNQQSHDTNTTDEHVTERKPEINTSEKTHTTPSNVMSNIQMWDPHTESTISKSSKLIEKPIHDRKFGTEVVNTDPSLPLHQRTGTDLTTHSTVSKTNETIARAIKPPVTDHKSNRDNKTKSASYEKNDTIGSLGSNQLFEKSTFLDYDDKQSIGTVGDDYNQKINSLKTIWDASDHSSIQLEQTINTMVAMKQKQQQKQQQQQQDNTVTNNSSTKSDTYVPESIPTSSANISVTTTNVSSTPNDDTNNKNPTSTVNLQSTGSSSTINQPPTYSTSNVSSKNEQKNICTVKPTQLVAPNIQDQVDVTSYQAFPTAPLLPPMSQASMQQQHILPQSQVNQLHQQHTYPFYENSILQGLPPPLPPQQQQQQQQQQFNRIYSSTSNTTSADPINSDFSSVQSSQIYAQQNFQYPNTNLFIQPPPPNVPNTNSMYHHTSHGSLSAPPQNNAMPPPMPNYPSPFLVDHGGHMISQPPQAYINNQMMTTRPQGGPYYPTPPQQRLQTPPGPPYGTQDSLAHGGYFPQFFQPPNSNAPPVGRPSPHNLYGQNEGFHASHPQMMGRAGSIDRNDHPLMSQSQSLSRPTNYPSTSSNQQQHGPPPSLLSQTSKAFYTNQHQTSNQTRFYPPPPSNQYPRQPTPVGAMNTPNNRQQPQQVPSLMDGFTKNFSNNGNNLHSSQSLYQHRQPIILSQTNTNRSAYQHQTPYPNYSKPTGPNDDNVKPKHI